MDKNDLIFQTEAGKFKAIAREVKSRYQKGQPVLVGTVSIEKNELLSEYLKAEGVPHEILNAKNLSIMNFLTMHQEETGLVPQNKQGGIFKSLNINPQRMLGFLWKGPQGIVAEEIIAPAIKEIIKKEKKDDRINELD